MKYPRLSVLLIDLESGYGGSSKSLFLSVKNIKEIYNNIDIEVWALNFEGIIKKYSSIGVHVRKISRLPRTTAGNTLKANILELARAGWILYKSKKFIEALSQDLDNRFDLVHFNLESAYLLAHFFRKKTTIPFVMHMRTIRPVNLFSRMQMKIISGAVNHLVFISPNELERFQLLNGKAKHTVIYNIAETHTNIPTAHNLIANENRFVVGSIANFSWDRGIDLLIEVAIEIKNHGGENEVLFVHAGHLEVPKSFPGDLGKHIRSGRSFEDYIVELGLGNMFMFTGHVDKPESVIQGCDLIIKLFRNGSPYGRDIIEAFSLGKAVLSTGTSEVFVKHMDTGILFPKFNAKDIAKEILDCVGNLKCKEMGIRGRVHINKICNPIDRAHDIVNVWRSELN
jgi:glycosyltransferase involved in cell wall biosynthesis